MTDYVTKQFFGTAQTLFNASTTNISASNFSAAGTQFDNTTDAAVPYATHAVAALTIQMAATPAAGHVIELWGLMQDIDGTTDETPAPATTASNGAHFLGAFVLAATTDQQIGGIVISLEGVRKFVPYIKNGATVATNVGSSGLTLKVTPLATARARRDSRRCRLFTYQSRSAHARRTIGCD